MMISTENIPDFTSTVYIYYGIDHEEAPKDTTKAIIHPSVHTIQDSAFSQCRFLVRVTITDTVTDSEGYAFNECDSLRFIRLPRTLEYIGNLAFMHCKSMEAVFLPPTVTSIDDEAFCYCTSLRFCIMGKIVHLGNDVFYGCDRLSTTDRNKLSRVCYSASVNPKTIQECIHTHGIERATEVNGQQMMTYAFYCKFKNYVLLLHARSSSSFILLRL